MTKFLVVVTLILVACSDSDGKTVTANEQACLDMADAVAKAAQRCGQDYKANYDAFVQTAAKGSCSNIVQLRDETSLRGSCIPSLTTISCADLIAAKLDASCQGQLLHPAVFNGGPLTPVSLGDFANIGGGI